MKIAMIGTRGVPARYGGFETAVEEIGARLVAMGHEVVVYCRGEDRSATHRGMYRVRLPAVQSRTLETLSHTALSVSHLLAHKSDVAFVFNAANAPLLPAIRAAGIPVAVHVDGLEWKRAKWGRLGRRYYLANERLAVKLAHRLISDAVAIQDYYLERYGSPSWFIPYGATLLHNYEGSCLEKFGLSHRSYNLVVARMEPENHVDVIIEGYINSTSNNPLVVVGSVPYQRRYSGVVRTLSEQDSRVRLLGGVWDQAILDALYCGSNSYIHGHSVGGTNPSLLRAMGAGADVIAWDVSFNREVLMSAGRYFDSASALSTLLSQPSSNESAERRRCEAQSRILKHYQWDTVASAYEEIAQDLRSCRKATFTRA